MAFLIRRDFCIVLACYTYQSVATLAIKEKRERMKMNKKFLYKILCLLTVLSVHQVNAAIVLNPNGTNYDVIDNGGYGSTIIDVAIYDNNQITLDFASGGVQVDNMYINLINNTGTVWTDFSIVYNTALDPYGDLSLGLSVLSAGSSTPSITSIISDPTFGYPLGFTADLVGGESAFLEIAGSAYSNYWLEDFSITIDVNAVPIPAAVWLFGSGLLGLVGMARRKKA